MAILDISHLSPQQRLDLIGKLWDSLDSDAMPVTPAQQAELDRRMTTLDADVKHARDAGKVLAELRNRYR